MMKGCLQRRWTRGGGRTSPMSTCATWRKPRGKIRFSLCIPVLRAQPWGKIVGADNPKFPEWANHSKELSGSWMARETLLPVTHNLDLDTLVMPAPGQHGGADSIHSVSPWSQLDGHHTRLCSCSLW